MSRKNKDFLENLDKRKGCEISENQGFKYYYTNTGKNALDYLVIAGNYLINLRIKVVRETPEDQRNMNISIFKKGIDKDGKGDVMFHQIKCYNMELSENMKNSIRFTPETKINASQVVKIKIVCPISGCEINNKIIGDKIKKL